MTYESRDEDEIRDVPDTYLNTALDEPALDDVDMLGAIIAATVTTLAQQQENTLERISRQAYLDTATGSELTRKARELGVERRGAIRATGVVEFSRDSDATTDYTIAEGTRVQTADGSVTFLTTETATLASGTQSVKANVRADDGGADGNLSANKLTAMPSPPTGVESVTNPNPTGDETKTGTGGDTLVPGQDRETDDELRARTYASTSIGGAATVGAIETKVRDVEGVRSVSIFANPTDSTDANGLPPYSNEVIVSGGNDTNVATALTEITSVTELYRLQGGIIGNGKTENIYIDTLDEEVAVDFSRPVDVTLNIDVDIVTTDTYIGDDALKNRIVDYVGGAEIDGSAVIGLGAGEDVLVNRVEDTIVGPAEGVDGIADLVIDADNDGNLDGADDRTTNSDGIEVISIATEEQAFLDAADITITEV